MVYDELTSGGLRVGGCPFVGVLRASVTAFGIGDTVYNIAKARRGFLEKVVIKVVRTVVSRRTQGANRVLYVDTLNGLWNEYDLVVYEKAVELIQMYFDAVEADRQRLPSC